MASYPGQPTSYAPMFVSPSGGQPYYVVQAAPAGYAQPQPVQYMMQGSQMYAAAAAPATQQPIYVQYPHVQPQPQQQPMQYVLAMPTQPSAIPFTMPQHVHAQQVQVAQHSPPMQPHYHHPQQQPQQQQLHVAHRSNQHYSIGLPQMTVIDSRPPPPYKSPSKSGDELANAKHAGSGGVGASSLEDSQDLCSDSFESIVCRHFLEGKCNRRKCRFKHTASPQSSVSNVVPPLLGDPLAQISNGTDHPATSGVSGDRSSPNTSDEASSVAELLSRLHIPADEVAGLKENA